MLIAEKASHDNVLMGTIEEEQNRKQKLYLGQFEHARSHKLNHGFLSELLSESDCCLVKFLQFLSEFVLVDCRQMKERLSQY